MHTNAECALEQAICSCKEIGITVEHAKTDLVLMHVEFSLVGVGYYILHRALFTYDHSAWRFQGDLPVPHTEDIDGQILATVGLYQVQRWVGRDYCPCCQQWTEDLYIVNEIYVPVCVDCSLLLDGAAQALISAAGGHHGVVRGVGAGATGSEPKATPDSACKAVSTSVTDWASEEPWKIRVTIGGDFPPEYAGVE